MPRIRDPLAPPQQQVRSQMVKDVIDVVRANRGQLDREDLDQFIALVRVPLPDATDGDVHQALVDEGLEIELD